VIFPLQTKKLFENNSAERCSLRKKHHRQFMLPSRKIRPGFNICFFVYLLIEA